MSVAFKEEDHSYTSLGEEAVNWTSVTSFIGKFKKPFNADEIAAKVIKSKRSKWYGMTKQQVLDAWSNEGKRAVDLGNWYHNQREADILSLETFGRTGKELPVFSPIIREDGVKIAPNQKLTEGIYPEHFVYLKSAGLCGQADLVEVVDGTINIVDYKTNKEIKTESYKNYEGISEKMFGPLSHLDDCNYSHYNIQMSIYMYIMLRHNPKLKPGTLQLQHVKFEQVGEDENGYPINAFVNGEPVVEDVIVYNMPYLKDEVVSLIHYIKDNTL